MAGGPSWTEAEDRAVRSLKPDEYNVWARQNGFPERGFSAITKRRSILNQMGVTSGLNTAQPSRDNYPATDVQSPVQFSVPKVSGNNGRAYSKNTPQTEITDYGLDPDPLPRFSGKPETDDDWERLFSHIENATESRESLSDSTKHVSWHAPVDGPIGIAFLSDIHVGSGGVLYKRFRADLETVARTPGLYAVINGDLMENTKVQSKSATALYSSAFASPREQYQYIRRRLHLIADKLIVVTSGNHDAWDYRHAGIDRLPDLCQELGAPYATEAGAALTVTVGINRFTIVVKHDYAGKSRINKSNSGRRLYQEFPHIMEHVTADVVALAHLHEPDMHTTMMRGDPVTLLRSGSYKVHDAWAESNGFKPQYGVPVIVLYPEERVITPMLDFQRGVRFLEAERRRWQNR